MASSTKFKDDQDRILFWEVRWRGPEGEKKRRVRTRAAKDDLLRFGLEEEAKRKDPLAYRTSSTVSLDFIVRAFLAAEADQWEGATRANGEGLIRNHLLLPRWKTQPLRHLHTGEIQNHWRDLLNGGTLGRASVLKIRNVLSLIFDFAILQGYVETNPVKPTKVPKVKQRDVRDAQNHEVAPDAVLSPEQVRDARGHHHAALSRPRASPWRVGAAHPGSCCAADLTCRFRKRPHPRHPSG